MRLSAAAKNLMLDAMDESVATGMKYGALHTAYSANGSANEVTGGSPAYARKAATWGAAAAGVKSLSASMVFDVPAGVVAWISFWDAVTAGNFLGITPNGGTTPQAFVVPDIANDTLECVAHGFSNGQTVVVWAVPGDPLPTGLAEGTIYYVITATTDDLQLSASSGGAAINITAIGAGFLQRIIVETFGAQGTHTVSAASLSAD